MEMGARGIRVGGLGLTDLGTEREEHTILAYIRKS